MFRKLIVLVVIVMGGGVWNTPVGQFPGPNALTIFGLFGMGLVLGLVLRGKG
jgi:hypothetical protein